MPYQTQLIIFVIAPSAFQLPPAPLHLKLHLIQHTSKCHIPHVSNVRTSFRESTPPHQAPVRSICGAVRAACAHCRRRKDRATVTRRERERKREVCSEAIIPWLELCITLVRSIVVYAAGVNNSCWTYAECARAYAWVTLVGLMVDGIFVVCLLATVVYTISIRITCKVNLKCKCIAICCNLYE